MAFNSLCTAFRKAIIQRQGIVSVRCYVKGQTVSNTNSSVLSALTLQSNDNVHESNFNFNIKCTPRTLNIDFKLPMNNGINRNIIEMPITRISIIENPNKYLPIQQDLPLPNKSIELPTNENIVEKQAVHMLIIRRRKMKKHQRKKLRKKMKFYWRKLKQKRELLKEKNFQAEQVALIQKTENFDPAKYVAERLSKMEEIYVPKLYRGEVIPQEMIKQFLDEKERKKAAKLNRIRLTP